ncbi:MAG: homoserine O-succinyltransferase, partial [Gammaproteobacteria bacterium]|nr:homoserine O-succinyltransferase [Gammaproteobacteria bacterium]
EETTLLKEYRRDVGRYLSAQQPHYPTLPHGYLNAAGVARVEAFRQQALARRTPELLERFPFAALATEISCGWHADAVQLYRNWLAAIRAARAAGTRAEPLSLSAS